MHSAERWLALAVVSTHLATAQTVQPTGALNFRDLGGIATSDGRIVRHGMIYRSGELNTLTDADIQMLRGLDIRYIFDLRTNAERTAAPTNWTANGPTVIPISAGFRATDDPALAMRPFLANGVDPANIKAAMEAVTAKIAIDGAPEIGTVLRSLGQGDEPAIVHCTAGKDRTGVVTSILLTLLGVPKEAVYREYLRSNEAVPAQMMRLQSAAAGSADGHKPGLPGGMPVDSIKIMMGVDRSFLDSAFAAINTKYGSFDAYVRDGLKLTPADVQALRARLLEPAGK